MSKAKCIGLVALSGVWLMGCGGNGGSTSSGPSADEGEQIAPNVTLQALNWQCAGKSLPSSVDLSTSAALPVPKNQGSGSSTCTAWGAGYATCTYMVDKQMGLAANSAANDASPIDLYEQLMKMYDVCDKDTNAQVAFNLLVKNGVASYQASPFTRNDCGTPKGLGTFGLVGYHSIAKDDMVMMKRELATGNVIDASFYADTNLESWGMQNLNSKTAVFQASGSTSGGHNMVIVGYNDGLQAWRVMNSSGTNWADGGFFWMSYSAYKTLAAYGLVADGGGIMGVLPSGGTNMPYYLQLSVFQFYDPSYNQTYLVFPFELGSTFFITSQVITKPDGTQMTQTNNNWSGGSYIYTANAQNVPFPAGRYTLTLTGTTAIQNLPVSISKTVTLGP
jgi:Papain family cysteine protease